MKKIVQILAFVLLALTAVPVIGAAPVKTPVWEQVQSAMPLGGDDVDRVEVAVKEGYIYVTVSRPMTVRIYSILGQLVTQQSVQSGTTRVRIGSRGVFILKAGQNTRRVTV